MAYEADEYPAMSESTTDIRIVPLPQSQDVLTDLLRAIRALRDHGQAVDQPLLPHLSPLGWEHINLTGDYLWRQNRQALPGKFRPLRPVHQP
jgi:Tn3 transposase DDE domain